MTRGRYTQDREQNYDCGENVLAEFAQIRVLMDDMVRTTHHELRQVSAAERHHLPEHVALERVAADAKHLEEDEELIFDAVTSGARAARDWLKLQGYPHLADEVPLVMAGAPHTADGKPPARAGRGGRVGQPVNAGINAHWAAGEAAGIYAGANKRTVWEIATQPYPDAHFATYPEELVIPCIAAGTSECGCCSECGGPWTRQTFKDYENPGNRSTNGPRSLDRKSRDFGTAGHAVRLETRVETTGWLPTCSHDEPPVPCVVLDPFAGSGTTLAVARKMGRRAIGIELNPAYLDLIARRIGAAALPLLEGTA